MGLLGDATRSRRCDDIRVLDLTGRLGTLVIVDLRRFAVECFRPIEEVRA